MNALTCLKHKVEKWEIKSDSPSFGSFGLTYATADQLLSSEGSSSYRAIEVIVQSWPRNGIETRPRGIHTHLHTSSVMITWTPPHLFSPPLETLTALFLGTVTRVNEFTFPPSDCLSLC